MIYKVLRDPVLCPPGFAFMTEIGKSDWDCRTFMLTPEGKAIDFGTLRERFDALSPKPELDSLEIAPFYIDFGRNWPTPR